MTTTGTPPVAMVTLNGWTEARQDKMVPPRGKLSPGHPLLKTSGSTTWLFGACDIYIFLDTQVARITVIPWGFYDVLGIKCLFSPPGWCGAADNSRAATFPPLPRWLRLEATEMFADLNQLNQFMCCIHVL